ncbi:hypothetical protein TIFTF001_014402 [Ficus carica]|uniref:ABC transporter domain-containing protein n=1 Tax=Ficus carica TaxID=3494 RepID=A0AA88D851_FICCA|nr:hypothetical protein TIFTF001_014402 [Ficus carica]
MGDNLLRYPELDQAVIGHSRQEQGQDDVRTSKHDGKQACMCRADPRQVGLDYGLSWKWFGRPNHSIVARPMFIEEVMELVELTSLRGALIGLAGVDGLSTEQRKRLTIAFELVANPSIIFMDEPTSGRDARAAAIVTRTMRNTAIDGVPKIRDGYNPATWMLEITSPAHEEALSVNFTDIYKKPELFERNKALIKELSTPPPNSEDLYFPTRRKQQDLFNAIGSIHSAILFIGVQNGSSVQPVVAIERTVFYRERAAGIEFLYGGDGTIGVAQWHGPCTDYLLLDSETLRRYRRPARQLEILFRTTSDLDVTSWKLLHL